MSLLKDLLRVFKKLWQSLDAPDKPPGALMVLRVREVLTTHSGDSRMHVELDIGIPLLSQHERDQGVKTRNFVAIKNGASFLDLPSQDAEQFTSVTLTPLQYGDKIELKMHNVDQAGNVSVDALDGAMVLADTVAPDGPLGSFTFALREVADDPAPPAPPAEEETNPSPPSG